MDDGVETVTLACAAFAQARTGRELGDAWGSWASTLRELPRGVAEPALCDAARAWWAQCAALEVSEALLSELRRAHRCPSVPAELLERSRPSSSARGALLEGPSADVARAPTEPPAPLLAVGAYAHPVPPPGSITRAELLEACGAREMRELRELRSAVEYALREVDALAGELQEVADEYSSAQSVQSRLRELVRRVSVATGIAA